MSYLSVADAATALQVKPSTLRDWVRRGLLKRTGPDGRPYNIHDLLAAKDAAKPRRVA
jgi:predicted site-specific integrase-resolvase